MIKSGVDLQAMEERDELFAKREIAPLPISAISHNIPANKYVRWEDRAVTGSPVELPGA